MPFDGRHNDFREQLNMPNTVSLTETEGRNISGSSIGSAYVLVDQHGDELISIMSYQYGHNFNMHHMLHISNSHSKLSRQLVFFTATGYITTVSLVEFKRSPANNLN
jgi:hypothetical protein